MQVNMHEAKSRLSELAEKVLKGEKVVIARSGKPILDLIPHVEKKQFRIPGGYENKIKMADDFDNTPDEIFDMFYGNSDE
jgi:antitoxin (DNA-binding transcriptional repressor) of toxin-antitoxin stability system